MWWVQRRWWRSCGVSVDAPVTALNRKLLISLGGGCVKQWWHSGVTSARPRSFSRLAADHLSGQRWSLPRRWYPAGGGATLSTGAHSSDVVCVK